MKSKFTFKQFLVAHLWKKLILMLCATLGMGFFLSLLIEVGWGTDPCSFLNLNVCRTIHWTLGTWQMTFNLILFILVFFFAPQTIGFGTLANMFLIGYTTDFFSWIWKITNLHNFIQEGNFLVHLGFFAFAIIFFIISASIYMNSKLGLGSYDAVVIIISERVKKVPFFVVRMCYDFSAVLIGFIASRFNPNGMQGSIIGSLIMSFLLGPTITLVGKIMNKLFFKDDSEENSADNNDYEKDLIK